jgi:hypothetical protein
MTILLLQPCTENHFETTLYTGKIVLVVGILLETAVAIKVPLNVISCKEKKRYMIVPL